MKKIIVILLLIKSFNISASEPAMVFTLQEVIALAQQQSPDILEARHNFRANYWRHVAHRANYLPALSFSSSPNFNRMINAVQQPDGTMLFMQQELLNTNAGFTISQNIPLTGGNLSVSSSLQRLDLLNVGTHSYRSVPLIISYSQTLFGFNQLRWDRRIEPLRFAEAKRRYVRDLEAVAGRAVQHFFNLALAQTNLEIANINFANADTLYVFAQGRYNIGTITENDMLQLEISRLTEERNRMVARMDLDNAIQNLRAFLGIRDTTPIEVLIDSAVPLIFIDEAQALAYATENSVDMLALQRQLLESDSEVARVRANTGLRADLFMQFGLAQTGGTLESVFQNPLDQQYVELGIRMPILDWGRGRGQREMARSNRDLVYARVEQEKINFEMNISRLVRQFNLQSYQLNVAARVDYTAERRSEVARRLFILGRSTILDLNASISERDAARRNYIHALHTYWFLYHQLRSITLFDFGQNIPITEDYRLLIR
jgi:outer membrane protein TolC